MKIPKTVAFSSVSIGLALALATSGFGRRSLAASPDPGTTDAEITRLTTSLLEHSQFAHHPFDKQLAGAFLDRYLDSLDGARSLFLQTDVDEFAGYRSTLAGTTRDSGDTTAARVIFKRYLQRLQERASFAADTLRTTTFDFTGHDVYSFDREHAPRPHDLAAAKTIWLQELKSEYLEEKLGEDKKTPGQIVKKLTERYAQQVRTMKGFSNDEVLEVYLDTLAHVYDPHSDYLGHEQMDSFSIAMNLSLVGNRRHS